MLLTINAVRSQQYAPLQCRYGRFNWDFALDFGNHSRLAFIESSVRSVEV